MLKSLFDMEKPFWRWVSHIPHMVVLSFLWFLLCLPIITIVPASVALYDTVVKKLRPDLKGVYKWYFKVFRAELKTGLLISVLWILIAGVFMAGDFVLRLIADESQMWAACMLAYPLLWLPIVLIFIWMIAVEARFNCKFITLHKNAIFFAFSCKLKSLLLLLIAVICIIACCFATYLILILPALITVLWSIPIEKEFENYYNSEQFQEIESRNENA